MGTEAAAFRQLVQRIDPALTLLRTWPLTGGVSAQVTAIEVLKPDGSTTKMVVRQHGEVDHGQNPQIARDEFRLLSLVHAHGVKAPRPLYVDERCDLFPVPVIVAEFVEGETTFDPPDRAACVAQMAEQLARIHTIADTPNLAFLPRAGRGFGERPAVLDDTLNEGRIRDTLESIGGIERVNRSVLLHNDFWPGNLLWNDGTLAGVIDWEDARVGDPLVDLGNTRLETLFAYGADAMQGFTSHYLSLTRIDTTNLPFWDLSAALRPCSRMDTWGLDEATMTRMRTRHAEFVRGAIERLPGRSPAT